MLYNSPSIEVLFFIPCFVLTIDLLAQNVNAQSGMVRVYVHFTSRTCNLYFQKSLEFLNQISNRNFLTPLCIKSEISALAQILMTRYYILFTNFPIWYEVKAYIGDIL